MPQLQVMLLVFMLFICTLFLSVLLDGVKEEKIDMLQCVCGIQKECTRRGGPDKLQMDTFTEALYDEDAGMTFPALMGQRKQSVQDAEILFSGGVEQFMKQKGYKYEEKFV